jgi:hypothetical protein
MNRRGFLRMLGTGAAVGGVAAVAPSQVWPFRKIFLPLRPTLEQLAERHLAAMLGVLPEYLTGTYPALARTQEQLNAIEALELEAFAKEIPHLIKRESAMYELYKAHERITRANYLGLRIPMRVEAVNPDNASDVKCAEAATKVLNMANGNRIIYSDYIAGVHYVDPKNFSWEEGLHGHDYVPGDMSMENLNRSEIIAGSLNEKPAYKLRRAARRFVDSLKVSNEDMGWDG